MYQEGELNPNRKGQGQGELTGKDRVWAKQAHRWQLEGQGKDRMDSRSVAGEGLAQRLPSKRTWSSFDVGLWQELLPCGVLIPWVCSAQSSAC